MFFITGDTHGDFTQVINFAEAQKLSHDDVIIILGDAGVNYYGSPNDEREKKRLALSSATYFCIHGNHEMRPETIPTYVEKIWNGGVVYVEPKYPNILFAKDGEIYNFNGYKTLVIGGAYSVDKHYRLQKGFNWFADEQPSDQTKASVEARLSQPDINWRVNAVLTHTCPYKYRPIETFLNGIDDSTVDTTTEQWLDKIEDKLLYGFWLCGHFHIDKVIDGIYFLYHSIIEVFT